MNSSSSFDISPRPEYQQAVSDRSMDKDASDLRAYHSKACFESLVAARVVSCEHLKPIEACSATGHDIAVISWGPSGTPCLICELLVGRLMDLRASLCGTPR